jgi:outer membrane lipoprotein-sorting protein
MTARVRAAWIAAMLAASCGAPRMTLPTGPGTPAPDAAQALAAASAACGNLTTMTAELAVTGRIGGRRVRTRLLAGLAPPASAYLDAPAPFGASAFVFVTNGEEGTLLLPRDRRVVASGRPAEILEAVTGVPLGPSDLRATLTGCAPEVSTEGAVALGDSWRLIRGTREVYLHRDSSADAWRLAAVVYREPGRLAWRAEYRDFSGGLPRAIRLTSADTTRFDLQFTLSQVETNVALDAATFRPKIPPGYTPITIEEIREAGPLADRSGSSDD